MQCFVSHHISYRREGNKLSSLRSVTEKTPVTGVFSVTDRRLDSLFVPVTCSNHIVPPEVFFIKLSQAER